jgi:hypothetical protein
MGCARDRHDRMQPPLEAVIVSHFVDASHNGAPLKVGLTLVLYDAKLKESTFFRGMSSL